ncbi:MAG: hypothetical protein JG767_1735 [Deferribacteraceae bacterium]|jgi:hypothetical protein|nr:hypothetical protein [Deferribacteraceae bacterium]
MFNAIKPIIFLLILVFTSLTVRALEVDSYNGQTCAVDRITQTLNCTAGEFTSTQ